jgi:hypothetical protein
MKVVKDLLRLSDSKSAFEDLTGGGGGSSDLWTRVYLASDHVNGTTTLTDVPGLTVTIPANTNFVIEGEFTLQTPTSTNLPRLAVAWSAGLTFGSLEIWYHTATARVFANSWTTTSAGVLQHAAGSAPGNAMPFGSGMFMKGRTGASACTIKVQLAAETAAANAAIMKAGAEFRHRSGF